MPRMQGQMGMFGVAPQVQYGIPAKPQFGILPQLPPIFPNLPIQLPQPLNIPYLPPVVPQAVVPKTPRKRQKASTAALHRNHTRARPSKAKKTQ